MIERWYSGNSSVLRERDAALLRIIARCEWCKTLAVLTGDFINPIFEEEFCVDNTLYGDRAAAGRLNMLSRELTRALVRAGTVTSLQKKPPFVLTKRNFLKHI